MSIDVDLLLELQVVLQGALLVLGGRWALPHPQHVRHVRLLLGGLLLWGELFHALLYSWIFCVIYLLLIFLLLFRSEAAHGAGVVALAASCRQPSCGETRWRSHAPPTRPTI